MDVYSKLYLYSSIYLIKFSKFKEIFDQINNNLNNFFTKIFGGGKAYLELTDNDLLNTGVSIMARPPGKLVKNINLLLF